MRVHVYFRSLSVFSVDEGVSYSVSTITFLMAQLVEHVDAKDGVTSSCPTMGSVKHDTLIQPVMK